MRNNTFLLIQRPWSAHENQFEFWSFGMQERKNSFAIFACFGKLQNTQSLQVAVGGSLKACQR